MLIGHEKLVEDFKRLAERNELSHAYIFSGPAWVGKKLFALCFANFLETGDFDSSSKISGGEIEEGKPNMLRDAFLLEPDEQQTIGIDEIRQIRNFLWQKPIVSGKKTVIINDAEALTGEAQNALLKIAEEPPESSLLVLIARDLEKLSVTLRSRFQKIYFSSVPSKRIESWLMVRLLSPQEEKFDGDRQQLQSILTLSSGQPGLAWRMLFDERFKALQKSGESFLKSGFWERREMIKTFLDQDDFNLNEFLEILLMMFSQGKLSKKVNLKLWHRILELRRNTDYLNLNPRLQLENLLNEV